MGTGKLGHTWIALKGQDSTMLLCKSLGRRERMGISPQRTIKEAGNEISSSSSQTLLSNRSSTS
jgi:hypothetical protein